MQHAQIMQLAQLMYILVFNTFMAFRSRQGLSFRHPVPLLSGRDRYECKFFLLAPYVVIKYIMTETPTV